MTLMRIPVCIALVSALAAPVSAATCPWTEPTKAPALEVVDGAARFTWPLDTGWFECARQQRGQMTVAFITRSLRGEDARTTRLTRTGAGQAESVPVQTLCADGLTSEVRVRVVGTGPMDRLLYETPSVPLPCFACPVAAKERLDLTTTDADSPEGFITASGRYDQAFFDCARNKAGATLSLRVYVGQSKLEAEERLDHSFVLRGLEKAAAFRKAFAPTNLCLEGQWIGVEYFGEGEFRQLNGAGRRTLALECPALP